MPTVYIGRECYYHGKSLFEIARNLRNFGVGRVVYRQKFKCYPEPSYYRLTNVTMNMNIDALKGYGEGRIVGQKVFRGRKFGFCVIEAAHKQDWRLVPKEEEEKVCAPYTEVRPANQIPQFIQIPPLMEYILREELKREMIDFDERQFYCRRVIQNKTVFNSAKCIEGTFETRSGTVLQAKDFEM